MSEDLTPIEKQTLQECRYLINEAFGRIELLEEVVLVLVDANKEVAKKIGEIAIKAAQREALGNVGK